MEKIWQVPKLVDGFHIILLQARNLIARTCTQYKYTDFFILKDN